MPADNAHNQRTSPISEGWVEGGSFFSSIISGTLLGLLADNWLGTAPWLVVVGILVGAYSGFMRVWQLSKSLEETKRDQ